MPSSERVEPLLDEDGDDGLHALAERLGHHFADGSLLRTALSHRSWCAEHGGIESNERLEFLGDAVLGLIVADHCYRQYPDLPEGNLARIRATVVNTQVLAEVSNHLGIGSVLLLGRGEEASGGREKASLLADALEAVIGAIHLDADRPAAREVVLRFLQERIDRAASMPEEFDPKSLLQERTMRDFGTTPSYVVIGDGPEHQRHFEATVYVDGENRGTGEGSSKKSAQQAAARVALQENRDA